MPQRKNIEGMTIEIVPAYAYTQTNNIACGVARSLKDKHLPALHESSLIIDYRCYGSGTRPVIEDS